MAILRQLLPVNSDMLAGVPISAAKATFLFGSLPGAAIANKCLVADINNRVSNISTLACTAANITSGTIDTINSGTAVLNTGTFTNLSLANPVFNNSIGGTAITDTITTDTDKVPSSYAINTLTNNWAASAYSSVNAHVRFKHGRGKYSYVSNYADGVVAITGVPDTWHVYPLNTLEYQQGVGSALYPQYPGFDNSVGPFWNGDYRFRANIHFFRCEDVQCRIKITEDFATTTVVGLSPVNASNRGGNYVSTVVNFADYFTVNQVDPEKRWFFQLEYKYSSSASNTKCLGDAGLGSFPDWGEPITWGWVEILSKT